MGRLKMIASKEALRGHTLRARSGELALDSSMTDGAGRFLLEWESTGGDRTTIELLDESGRVTESVELADADLLSPAVIGFSGERVVISRTSDKRKDSKVAFEADGDYPLCVTSSCIEVSLSWVLSRGSRVSLISEGGPVRESLPWQGSLKVVDRGSRRYIQREWLAGAGEGSYSDRTLEVRRYPSLSLVMEGVRFKKGSHVDFGVSISCPATEGGLKVSMLTSDAGLVPPNQLTIAAGSTWASTRVRLGEKTGKAEVTATATGYVRDGVTFMVE